MSFGELIEGFLINKFRGDASLLDSAISYTYEYTGKPTLGVVPMIRDIGIPEEDSVSFELDRRSGEVQALLRPHVWPAE